MALGSGLAAQIGYAEESTYGTRVVPTRFLELVDEGLSFEPGRDESQAIRSGNRVLRSDRWSAGRKVAGGSVSHEIANKGFSLLFKHMLGDAPTITTPGGGTTSRDHTFDGPGDPLGMMLTCQVGRPDVGGTVRPFDYLGCKVGSWEISQALDAYAMLSLELDARDEDTAQSLATASFPAGQTLFGWKDLAVTIGGAPFDVNTLTIAGENPSKTDRYFVGATTKKQPIVNALAPITCELTGEFESMTQYDRVRTGATTQLVATWTGAIIEAAIAFKLQVTLDTVRVDGATPAVSGRDLLEQPLRFVALDDGTDPPIRIVYTTTDTAI
jgi:Phage tail tube protein